MGMAMMANKKDNNICDAHWPDSKHTNNKPVFHRFRLIGYVFKLVRYWMSKSGDFHHDDNR